MRNITIITRRVSEAIPFGTKIALNEFSRVWSANNSESRKWAAKTNNKLQPADIQGCKYFKLIPELLQSLHNVGTERDTAGNRKFFFDQYVALQLLYFFSPVVTRLNGLREATDLKKVKKLLGIKRGRSLK